MQWKLIMSNHQFCCRDILGSCIVDSRVLGMEQVNGKRSTASRFTVRCRNGHPCSLTNEHIMRNSTPHCRLIYSNVAKGPQSECCAYYNLGVDSILHGKLDRFPWPLSSTRLWIFSGPLETGYLIRQDLASAISGSCHRILPSNREHIMFSSTRPRSSKL